MMGNSNQKVQPVSNGQEEHDPQDDFSDCFCKCCTVLGRWAGLTQATAILHRAYTQYIYRSRMLLL